MNSWKKIKSWFIKMGSTPGFFNSTTRYVSWFGLFAFLILTFGLIWGIFFSPPDYKQGEVYRIIYIHVPSAILAESVLITMSIFGFLNLVWRVKIAGMLVRSAAPIGASFTFLALISGSIWGYPTWGTWWVWDARLTSTLLLFFIYASIIGLYSFSDNQLKGDKSISLLSIVGIAIIPIIKKSVDWWQTLHQPSTFSLTSSPSMSPEMYIPLAICVIGFYFIYIFMLIQRLRVEILYRERDTRWVGLYFQNKLEKIS
ncbi:MAG: heme ABC transporter permease CcmC [SAR86 cluster bacterium]|nr:heme ABC transporter permease CcmC [SAR86 cluster bacterium]